MRVFKNILFFLILIVMLTGISQRLDNIAETDEKMVQSRNKSMIKISNEKENTIDVLVAGDSASFSSVSPMLLWRDHGFTSYVCSQTLQNIQETYYMLEAALDTQSPELVVLETHIWFNSLTGVGGLRATVSQLGNYYLPVFRYHDLWKPILMGNHYEEPTYKGFKIWDDVASYDGGDYMKETKGELEISYTVEIYMDKIIELCEEKGAKLLLLSTPSPINYNYKRYNAIKKYAKENSLPYLDLNLKAKELGIDWKTDSQDKGDHLNLSGAHKATKYIGDYLAENYDLPDHRDDASYQEWADLAQKYEVMTKERLDAMKK
ncbi:MAG: SGNH/GDSL hydrolase family protein [Lachnospiraceae bacterium]